MKIAIFTDVFHPLINGVVTNIINTTQLLCQNHQLVIFAPKPKKPITIKPLARLKKSLKFVIYPAFPPGYYIQDYALVYLFL